MKDGAQCPVLGRGRGWAVSPTRRAGLPCGPLQSGSPLEFAGAEGRTEQRGSSLTGFCFRSSARVCACVLVPLLTLLLWSQMRTWAPQRRA